MTVHSSRLPARLSVFALLCCAASFSIVVTATAAASKRDTTSVEQARASMQASLANSRAIAPSGSNRPSDIIANPNRAYPPSCLSDGLPFGIFRQFASDPAPLQQQLTLPGDYNACQQGGNTAECNYNETVTISVWRAPCSANSVGAGTSATLLEIDRPCGACGSTSLYPTFPLVSVTQGNNSLYIRLADDPNTWYTTVYANSPIVASNIYVLENFLGGSVQFDYNQAFTLTLDNTIQFNVPAYNSAQYGANTLTLPISGYMTSNWFDPAHGGEGILTQVFDNADGTRTFTAAWYTFDDSGLPFWLFAQGVIDIGDRTTGNVDTYYATGGCFAGVGCGSASFTKWGTINFSFPDCSHMNFTYNGDGSAVNGPKGSSQRSWLRIANVNSIVCN